ncbi:MAG: hypothetical protein ACYCYM_12550 [Saccharofermentanales bacterium]
MTKIIMGIQLEHRKEVVAKVQALLSEYGCYIRTRLGVHEATDDSCSESGLILLEFVDSKEEVVRELEDKLGQLQYVVVKTMQF